MVGEKTNAKIGRNIRKFDGALLGKCATYLETRTRTSTKKKHRSPVSFFTRCGAGLPAGNLLAPALTGRGGAGAVFEMADFGPYLKNDSSL